MKKKNIAFASLTALGLGGLALSLGASAIPASAEENSDPIRTALAFFSEGYRATGEYTVTYDYPDTIAAADYSTSGSFVRDYAFILEEDGSRTNAVREFTSNGAAVVHIEDEKGAAVQEKLNRNNEVVEVREQNYLADVLFSEFYKDPFDFLTPSDFTLGEDGTIVLSGTKTAFLIDEFFGLSFPGEKTVFTLDGYGRPTSMTLYAYPCEAGVVNNDGTMEIIDLSLDAKVDFDFSFPAIEHQKALAYDNPALESAMSAVGDNYTITIVSNAALASMTLYATKEGIYLHLDNSVGYPVAGDTYYALNAAGTAYNPYEYDGSSWSRVGMNYEKDEFLPDYASMLCEQYRQDGPSTYVLESVAAPYGASSLVPDLLVSDYADDGLAASITLKDGKLDTFSMSYGLDIMSIAISESWTDYGTTTLPSWFSSEDL